MIKHPGIIFDHLVVCSLALSTKEIAERTSIDHERLLALLDGEERLTPYDCIKFGAFSHTEPADWLKLQYLYDRAVMYRFPQIAVDWAVKPIDQDLSVDLKSLLKP